APMLSQLMESQDRDDMTDVQRSSHLSQVVSILSRQLVELEDNRKQIAEQQQVQRIENLRLSEWIESRETWVQERESVFSQQLEELSRRERICQQERETWRKERIEVEKVIRDLVQQLESAAA